MKAGIFLMLVMLVAQGFALPQKPPYEIQQGYERVKWGSTVAQVRTHYPQVSDCTYDNKEYDLCLEEKNPNQSITERFFYFLDNKLVVVVLNYDSKIINTTFLDVLMKSLEKKYGRFHEITPTDSIEYIKDAEVNFKGHILRWLAGDQEIILEVRDIHINGSFFSAQIRLRFLDKASIEKIKQKDAGERKDSLGF